MSQKVRVGVIGTSWYADFNAPARPAKPSPGRVGCHLRAEPGSSPGGRW